MEYRKKTGLFFGSFNPIHMGHLILVSYFQSFTDLEEVWLIVSPQNPLKPRKSLLDDHHRLEMVRIALADHPRLRVSDIEFRMPRPSYTIDTLSWLHEKHPGRAFVLLCGTDVFGNFHKWKNHDQILKYYQIYAYQRPGFDLGLFKNHPHIKVFDAPQLEISSTFIRKGISEEKDMSFWMPSDVYRYIREMHFYERF